MSACTDLRNPRLCFTLLEYVNRWIFVRGGQVGFVWHLYQFWLARRHLVASAKFSISATTPSIQLILLGNRQSMEPASYYFLYLLVLQPTDDTWQLSVFSIPMTALAFVIRCSTTTPSVNDTMLIQGNRVEVSAVDLCYLCSHVCESLHKTWLVRWGSPF